ncbi:replication-associated recombination protein A [Gemelliphila asaccharolytica]|uniref:ATPase, AAA family n=1 Tax=Gemelliphila asaccharolytica TaxID=502393 RepID=A0ABR5TMQ8_9BACL|nr:replication-associated recombination protein A [Gemella asaccharolytica]KXB58013.1 ATPase, AAA family [Gemella asaccharolytica]
MSLINSIRPKLIKDIVGQKHLIGENKILTKIVQFKAMFSFILYGPTGTGKTSIAMCLANELDYKFKILNAVNCTKKDLTDIIYESKNFKKILLLIDEFHRLTKPMQDVLLPEIEFENIFIIGCTTHNPYHSISPAVRSRLKIFELKPINYNEISDYLKKIFNNKDIFNKDIKISDSVFNLISKSSSGDLRFALNSLEIIYNLSNNNENIDIETFKNFSLCNFKKYDKNEDYFYNTISALQKSIRGSDVNAALFYLALLIESGDLEIICRRLLVICYEDIGLANPNIGPFVYNAIESAKSLGFPEARIPLSNVVIQMSLSKKSNTAIKSIDKALKVIKNNPEFNIPNYLKDNHYLGAENLKNGVGYKFPHDYKYNYVYQEYLPNNLKNEIFYEVNQNNKNEKSLYLYNEFLKKLK